MLSPALAQLRGTPPELIVDVFEVERAAGLGRVRLGRADVEVLEAARRAGRDVVLLDIGLPGVSELEVSQLERPPPALSSSTA